MTRFRKYVIGFVGLLILLVTAAFFVWRSEWLANQIRARAIAEIQKATGAQISLGRFNWDWARGLVHVQDITIHGREAATDKPFIYVAKAEISLKIMSFISPNVDLKAVTLIEPAVHIVTYADGSTNLPRRQKSRRPDELIEDLLKLGIDHLNAAHGTFSWNHHEVPFNIRGENLQVELALDGQHYRGLLAGKQLSLKLADIRELHFSMATKLLLTSDGVSFEQLHAELDDLRLEASGRLENWQHPTLDATVKGMGPVRDLVRHFDLPLPPVGIAEAMGRVTYKAAWQFSGQVAGRNLTYRDDRFSLKGVNVTGETLYRHSPDSGHRVDVGKLRVDSEQGNFRGSASAHADGYQIRGTMGNVRFNDAQHFFDPTLPSWGSLMNGPVNIEGNARATKATARLTLIATDDERPLNGIVNLVYDSATNDVRLTGTHLESNSTKVQAAGNLLGGLDVDLVTANLKELPFVNRLPVSIEPGGLLVFRGLVSGGLREPSAKGLLIAKSIRYEGELVERARTQVDVRSDLLKLDQLEIHRGNESLTGNLGVSLFDWETRGASTISGRVSALGVEVEPHLTEATGRAKGSADISGSLQDPRLDGQLEWNDAVFMAQTLDTVSGRVTYTNEQIDVRGGRFKLDGQPVEFSGTYVHEPNDLRNGAFQGSTRASGLQLEKLGQFRNRFPSWAGRLDIDARARGRISAGQPDFSMIDGRAVVQRVAYEGKPLGAVSIHARTEPGRLSLTASGLLRGAAVTATSQWQLAGLMPGEAKFEVKGAKFDDFQELVASQVLSPDPTPFDVRLEASGALRGNLRDPQSLKGGLKISQLAIVPRQAMSESARRDFTLRNEGPIEITYDAKGLNIQQANLLAKDTKLTATGLVSLGNAATANIRVVGDANLAVLSALKADLIAAGRSTLDLSVRGTLTQPIMAGRMELRDASFFLRDVSNGLERVNGAVFFDRSRARLENLTAQSGGGTIRLSGFIGFSEELSYQLQAQADNVRVRYPEGVTTAVNSSLTLAGSASRSLLSGSVTLLRAALNPRTDLGTIIAESSRAEIASTRIENEFLKNMQFDVRVDTALNAQVTTSLTQNVEAEVNLRLRGTPTRPVLLGRTSFTQGEISFFGTKYTIDRGEVNFYNQTKVEPVINLDLQTRVRGVVVTINFSGPASKLNLSYRSDPPLQSSEILALLTVGRTPNGSVASGANVQSPTFLQGASSALLGQAVAAPITGRLQRLFGVSRVRIDPQLTGIENTAQARLTIEQQVSRDITVTFITNLNRTQQQIVSVEWDFSREFSALAIRDENGVFGLDFFYRKRFK